MTDSYYNRFRLWQDEAIGKRIFEQEQLIVETMLKKHKPAVVVQLEGKALLDVVPESMAYYHLSEDANVVAKGYTVEAEQGFMPFPDRSVDLVLVGHALEIYQNRSATLAEIERVLAPGGQVFLSVFLKRWFEDGVPKQYHPLMDLHVTPLSMRKLQSWLEAEDLKIEVEHKLVEEQSYMMTERLTDIMIHPMAFELVRLEVSEVWDGMVGVMK